MQELVLMNSGFPFNLLLSSPKGSWNRPLQVNDWMKTFFPHKIVFVKYDILFKIKFKEL